MKLKLLIIIFLTFAFSLITADGFIVTNFKEKPYVLEVKYHRVHVTINDLIVKTEIDQEFYNPANRRLEGTYLFPFPDGAAIGNFSMFINGKETKAELLNTDQARKSYEDIVRKQRDPALLEYIGRNVFKVRIFPIEARSRKRIKISYYQTLTSDNGLVEYVYPLNTEKFSSELLKNVSVVVDIKTEKSIQNVYSPTHKMETVYDNQHKVRISYEQKNIKPDKDFKLLYKIANDELSALMLAYKKTNKKNGFFYLNINPHFQLKKRKPAEKDICFVLDVSGSMAGKNLSAAKNALRFCLENLNTNDRFNLIRFSTQANALFSKLKTVNKDNLNQADVYIEELEAIGGTNIEQALSLALDMDTNNKRPYYIIFITDGKPTIGKIDNTKLISGLFSSQKDLPKIFTIGIGREINTHLLDIITKKTNSFRTYISETENIDEKVENLYLKLKSPILTDCSLKFSKNVRIINTHPNVNHLPDLFEGPSLTVLGQYTGNGKVKIYLDGYMENQKKQFVFEHYFPENSEKHKEIPVLWATRRIGYLLDEIRLHGEQNELVAEATHLARSYGIITPYTSFLILEDEQQRIAERRIDRDFMTFGNLPLKAKSIAREANKEKKHMEAEDGEGSVIASMKFQGMQKAGSLQENDYYQNKPNDKSADKLNSEKETVFRLVNGRSFYLIRNKWVDSALIDHNKQKPIRIRFLSEQYFALMHANSIINQYLSIGKNVVFFLGNKIYEIHE